MRISTNRSRNHVTLDAAFMWFERFEMPLVGTFRYFER